jgi:hypothetical protein
LLKLAGVVAVEITGGPEIPFHPGRPVSEPQYCHWFPFSCIVFFGLIEKLLIFMCQEFVSIWDVQVFFFFFLGICKLNCIKLGRLLVLNWEALDVLIIALVTCLGLNSELTLHQNAFL